MAIPATIIIFALAADGLISDFSLITFGLHFYKNQIMWISIMKVELFIIILRYPNSYKTET